ncbi:MAG: putative porin [Candidatus Omnitrophica bacterium]|nr:putative porin [Candidatus Omnitrophota bacterium]
MKRIFVGVFLLLSFLVSCPSVSQAGEMDILVDKLVEKGILSPVEAQIILDETKQQVAKELAEQKSYAAPSWTQKIKLKGDFRLRYQYERRNADSEGRTRGRYRFRLGGIGEVTDQFKVGFGLATGGSDPKSTNQTFNNDGGQSFVTPDIRLDYAYFEYQPMSKFMMAAGKFKMKPYLWKPTDMLWDSDINPEGVSAHWEDVLAGVDDTDYWLNTGVWQLEHNDQDDRPDPFLPYVQVGVKNKSEILKKDVDTKLAATFYSFQGLHGNDLTDSEGGNSTGTGGVLGSDYTSLGLSAEVGVRNLFGGLPFKADDRIAFIGDFIHNFDDDLIGDEKTTGWTLGAKFGHKKVKKPGSWQAKYLYVVLGADSFPDAFPDSDRGFGGETNIKSHEVAWKYALRKNVTLGLDYYQTRHYAKSGSNDVEHLVQADIALKF